MLTPTRIAAQPATLTSGSQAELDAVRAALSDEYEIVREIGRGGMAIVYLARDRSLDRDVAIKVLPAQFTFDQGFVERFQREARIAAQLEHPHIIPIHRVAQSGSITYLVMKLVRGQSLGMLLSSCGTMPAADVRRMLIETASALGNAARRGIVHRDVKPDNIMIDEDGRFIVTDFGIARSAAEVKLTSTGMAVGTPRYMSPEQARALAVDGRSDLYSLGVVGYEALVGTPPFSAPDALALLLEHINAPVPRPPLRTAEDKALYAVIERLLEKKPADRLQSAEELIAALQGKSPAAITPRPLAGDDERLAPTRPLPAVDVQVASRIAIAGKATQRAVGVMARAAATMVGRVGARASTLVARSSGMRTAARARSMRLVAGVRAVSPRVWVTTSIAIGVVTALYYAVHFATKHQSRCPDVAEAPSVAGSATPSATTRTPAAVTLLVDNVRPQNAGSALDVYYDVCGLPAGTEYSTSIRVAKNGWGLKRILGTDVSPVSERHDEVASGEAVRRHRSIDIDAMPAGSYSLAVSITIDGGRRRDREITFQVVE